MERFFRILCVVLIAYIAGTKWQEKRSVDRIVEYGRSNSNNAKKLQGHAGEFNKPEVIKVTEGIYVAIGYALANSILIEAPEGAIIIDTVESMDAAEEIYAAFRKVTKSPVKAIVYTHNHQDHVNGAEAFLKDVDGNSSVHIWSHRSLMDIFRLTNYVTGPIIYKRAMRQFGAMIEREKTPNSGIGFGLNLGDSKDYRMGFVPPNRFLDTAEADVNIAGLKLKLLHIPGETDDQIAVYWPSKQALFCADDVYKAFPNLYAIRGTPFRSLELWTQSLDRMYALNAEYLVPSHTRPIVGKQEVSSLLLAYRDAVQTVHDQTVRWMNRGLHPDDIAHKVSLTKRLSEHEFLQEFYGTVAWSVKGLFAGYLGWFSGYPEELSPLSTEQQAIRLVQLAGGEDRILDAADKALGTGDFQWALQLAAAALRANPKSTRARELKVKAIFELAAGQISANGYNYYTTCAYEELGKIDTTIRRDIRARTVFSVNLETLFQFFRFRFNFEACSHLDKLVEFQFTDAERVVRFHIREGIVDLVNTGLKAKPDVKVSLTEELFRKLLAGEAAALVSSATGGIAAEPGLMEFREVMNCFDKD